MINIGTFTTADRISITRALFEEQDEAAAIQLLGVAQKMGVTNADLLETCERLEADLGKFYCKASRPAVAWVAKRMEAAA